MSLSKPNLNILSSYVNNWNFRSYKKSHWSDVLLSHFIVTLNYKGFNLYYINNYILDLCDGLIDELLYKN